MELRQYWNVISRRRWLVLAILGLTTLVSGFMLATAKLSYEAETKFITRQEPTPNQSNFAVFTFDRYYNWFGSEFLVDDYTQIVQSDAFARAVRHELETAVRLRRVRNLTDDQVKSALEADRRQRELRV